jgi:hypothetical protein
MTGKALVIVLLAIQAAGPSMRAVQIPNDVSYWEKSGFVEMVPPVRLPTDKVNDNAIQVWVKLPAGGTITGTWLEPQHRFSLKFPAGTIADRVEIYKHEAKAMLVVRDIEDVRGARIDSDGHSIFHVYEPVPGGDAGWLKGYEWRRTDNEGDRLAGEALIKLYYLGHGQDAEAEIQGFRRTNQCGACHQPDRPAPKVAARPMLHASDSHGFYQPLAVLEDSMTVRTHRKWDLNADDPFVSVWCGAQKVAAITDGDSRGYKCPDEAAAVGRLDLRAALAAKDVHALQVCKARRYLFDHMDRTAREAYRPSFEECSIH